MKEIVGSIREDLKRIVKNSWLWLGDNALYICTDRNNYTVSIKGGCLRISVCLRVANTTKQINIQRFSLIVKKIEDITSMKVNMHPGTRPDILQLSGQAQHRLESIHIAGILKAESAYMMKSIIRIFKATEELTDHVMSTSN